MSINTFLPSTNTHTRTLTSKLTINAQDGVFIVAILYVSGTVTIQGNNSLQAVNSSAISLSSSNPSVTVGGGQNPLNNFVIDASSGNCQIICYF